MLFSCKNESQIKNQEPFKNLVKVVEVEKPIIDLGRVDKRSLNQEIITIEFNLNNISSNSIKIDKIESSCTCTVSSYPKALIESNSSFWITATYDNLSPGYFEQDLVVYFEGSDASPVLLVFRGNIL
tara:strand:- start:19849 stop:20229 length:381 start_codon:yes stop_codon:yes gene_type:complete